MDKVKEFFKILGSCLQDVNSIQYLVAFGFIFLGISTGKILQHLIIKRFKTLAGETKNEVDDFLADAFPRPLAWLYYLVGVYYGINALALGYPRLLKDATYLSFSDWFYFWVEILYIIPTSFLICLLFVRIIDVLGIHFQKFAEKTETTLDDQLITVTRVSSKVFCAVLAIFLSFKFLDKFDFLIKNFSVYGLELSLMRILAAIVFVFGGILAGKLINYIVGSRLTALAEKTDSEVDDYLATNLRGPLSLIAQTTGLYFAIKVLEPRVDKYVFAVYQVILAFGVSWLLFRLVDALALHLKTYVQGTESTLDDQLIMMARKTLKVVLAIIAGLMIIQNLGYSVSGLLAGVGLGGLAVAMAAKDTIANLFGSLTIFLDRPFQLGDFIKIDSYSGTVEEIGFRSIRLRTSEDTLVTVPNQKFSTASIDNFSKRGKRKVFLTLGLTYDATREKIEVLVKDLKEIFANEEKTKDNYYVAFSGFGESSLDITVYYKIITKSYGEFLEVNERINLNMMKCVEEKGLEFAFPSRTLYHVHDTPTVETKEPNITPTMLNVSEIKVDKVEAAKIEFPAAPFPPEENSLVETSTIAKSEKEETKEETKEEIKEEKKEEKKEEAKPPAKKRGRPKKKVVGEEKESETATKGQNTVDTEVAEPKDKKKETKKMAKKARGRKKKSAKKAVSKKK